MATLKKAKTALNTVVTTGETPEGYEYYSFADARKAKFKFDLKVRTGTKKDGTPCVPYCYMTEPGSADIMFVSLTVNAQARVKVGESCDENLVQLLVREVDEGTIYRIAAIGEAINLV